MLRATSIVRINRERIRHLTNTQIQALEMTAEALHTEVIQSQVMPFKEGTLQNESTFVDYSESKKGKVSLVSTAPYARRLYYHPEYNFSKTENPNAMGKWYKDWITGDKNEFPRKTFKKIYRRLGRL